MRSAQGALSLERNFYSDPAIYAREQTAIFSKSWLLLGRLNDHWPLGEISHTAYKTLDVAGSPVVLLRTADGTDGAVRGFHNVCRHRGAMLLDEPSGCLEKGVVVCPYHAWSYDCLGRLVGAPNMADVESFQRTDYGLHPVRVETLHGFVFANLDRDACSVDSFLQPLERYLEAWSVAELETVVSLEYNVRANWKSIFENFNECYHCPTIHPALNRLTPYRNADNEFVDGPILGGPMRFADGIDTMSQSGARVGKWLPKLNENQRRTVCYFTVFPSFFISFHPDYVMVHRLEPLAVDSTKITCEFLFHPDSKLDPKFDPSLATDFWHLTNQQDWEVSERVQLGARSAYFQPGPLSNLEDIVAAFDRYYLSVVSQSI